MGDGRKQDLKAAQCAYRMKFSWFRNCIYCGNPATDLDHVMPLSIVARTEFWRESVRAELVGGLWLVPACNECNVLAGATPFRSILKKRAFIKAQLRHKYRKYLRATVWDEDEISRLGRTLRSKILHDMQIMARIDLRLAWPNLGSRVSVATIQKFRLVK